MITRTISALLAFLISLPLFATTYTMAPSSGPTGGGTQVTITATDGTFGTWTYEVLFGGVPARSTQRVDEHTLVAVTPEHMPGDADVTIFEYDMFLSTDLTFTFTGGVPASFERLLVPLLVPPVFGAFGSEFHTDLLFATAVQSVPLWGLEYDREHAQCPPVSACLLPDDPVTAGQTPLRQDWVRHNGTPGRFIYVDRDQLPTLAMNLRAYDVSRAALNFGTELPIVRQQEFVESGSEIVLLDVPTDPRFRNTLRIYSSVPETVYLDVNGQQKALTLTPGANIYEPAFAQFGDFPMGVGPVRVTVSVPGPPVSGHFGNPFWAFISVTNNETQMITTITPQP